MADRNVTVLNPAGYQEQLPDTDNLVLTLAPSQNQHGSNKKYVDDTVQSLRTEIVNAIADLEGEFEGDLTLYVQKAGSTMTGTLDWQAAGGGQSAYIQRTGDALFENLYVNSDLSAAEGEFSGDVTVDGNLSAVDGDFTGDISAINADFTGDVSLAQITVDQINLRSSNAGNNGFINSQNFNVDEPSLTITNTGPLSLVGTPVDITGVTTIATSLRVGNFADYVYFIGGTGELSGELTVKGDVEVGNFNTQGIKLVKDGYIDCNRQAANHSIYRGKLNGAVNINLFANGDATFNGDVVASTLDGDIDQGEY